MRMPWKQSSSIIPKRAAVASEPAHELRATSQTLPELASARCGALSLRALQIETPRGPMTELVATVGFDFLQGAFGIPSIEPTGRERVERLRVWPDGRPDGGWTQAAPCAPLALQQLMPVPVAAGLCEAGAALRD